ncbi:helix-turn-helix domain-containing protein [Streptomyces pseudovenezuelae]|uniref:helix-turn-helix domain-containing protein n=1 Tax=Streptomyces pseudovenezuelae TaxID=67350 RepID=UPI0036E3DA17
MTSTASPFPADENSQAYHLRRKRELSSLYATARSLTALGELDDVLRSIVRHAHGLIGTDFTYLSLLGPDNALSVRASEGTISADFLAAGIPPGTGLGGQVIERRKPIWVSNYLVADELNHDHNFDGLVAREGLTALLGVPLLVRGQAVGALFAADRSERSFSSEEIALFSAFADHAAIALDNARLYDQSRTALEKLQSAYHIIEEHVATIERSQAVHEALTDVVLTGGGPKDVARHLADQMGGAVIFLGRDNTLLAGAGLDQTLHDSDSPAWFGIMQALEGARRTGRCMTQQDASATHSVAAVQAGDSYLGALVWSQPASPSSADLRMLERATHIVALMILKENAVADAAERLSGELMTDLLVNSPAVSAAQRARTRARGIDVDALNVLVVADSTTVATLELSRQLHVYAQNHAGLAGEYLGRATMLLHAEDVDEAVADGHRAIRQQLDRDVNLIGEPVQGHDWARAFTTASRCLDLALALGKTDHGATTSDYALYALLFAPDRINELDRFISTTIGPLLAYDTQRATDLVTTAATYFANRGSLAQTARALRVHLNTLLKRLDRIDVVLGSGWRESEALDTQLALRMHQLRVAVGI